MNIPPINYSSDIGDRCKNDVYTLDFSYMPYGTHKDIRSQLIVEYAIKNNISKLHIITSGNAGLSLKKTIEKTNKDIFLTCIVSDSINESIALSLIGPNSNIMKYDLEREDITKKLPNLINNSFDVTYVKGNPYIDVISTMNKHNFDYIIIPLGSGELYTRFLDYIKEHKLSTKLIGVIPFAKHPLSKEYRHWASFPDSYADKLTCKFINSKIAIKIKGSEKQGNMIYEITNQEISELCAFSKTLNYSLEPSGAVGLCVPTIIQNKKILCVLTGNGNIKTKEKA